eukprot:779215-Prymnesium_polylepis.1
MVPVAGLAMRAPYGMPPCARACLASSIARRMKRACAVAFEGLYAAAHRGRSASMADRRAAPEVDPVWVFTVNDACDPITAEPCQLRSPARKRLR